MDVKPEESLFLNFLGFSLQRNRGLDGQSFVSELREGKYKCENLKVHHSYGSSNFLAIK